MEINALEIHELESLKKSIDDRIQKIKQEKVDEIKRKDSVKNKTKLYQLTSNDRILVITIFENVKDNRMVSNVSYENINQCDKDDDSMGFKFGHGGSLYWISNEDSEKHYVLKTWFGKHNHVFCTLKPESWIQDLAEAKGFNIEQKKQQQQDELNYYMESLIKFDELKTEITKKVNNVIEIDNK